MKDRLEKLLMELSVVYDKSDAKYVGDKELYYSLLLSPLQKNRPLLVGINWGGGGSGDTSSDSYGPQKINQVKIDDIRKQDLGCLKNTFKYITEYFSEEALLGMSQTNICFFRTPKETDLTVNDYNLCEHIFQKLIGILQPSMFLCFSSELGNRLAKKKEIDGSRWHPIGGKAKSGGRPAVYVLKDTWINEIPIYFLPHPQAHLTAEDREEAWVYCFGKP